MKEWLLLEKRLKRPASFIWRSGRGEKGKASSLSYGRQYGADKQGIISCCTITERLQALNGYQAPKERKQCSTQRVI